MANLTQHTFVAPDPRKMPFLPAVRQRRLTVSDESGRSSLDNYGVFARLPLELRRLILVHALGGRTLHMQLSWDHPVEPRSKQGTLASRYRSFALAAGRMITRKSKQQQLKKPAGHCGLGTRLVINREQRRGWHWFGCVCHRREYLTYEEWESYLLALMYTPSRKIPRGWDSCCSKGYLCACQSPQWCAPASECFVGAMSWLLSCRQAYSDAIDILYSENTLLLSGGDFILNLPKLLLPQRLSRIRSVELLWSSPEDVPADARTFDDTALRALCDSIPETFPQVEKLYLSLQIDVHKPSRAQILSGDLREDPILAAERALLAPVEDMLLRLPRQSCRCIEHNIAIPGQFWKVLLWKHDALRTPGMRPEIDDARMQHGRLWKTIPGQVDGQGNDMGYWVCSRYEDGEDVLEDQRRGYIWGLWNENEDFSRSLSGPHVILGDVPYDPLGMMA